jgi:hypothetical protein
MAESETPSGDLQTQADLHVAQTVEGLSADEAAIALAVLINRAATRLHNLARSEATTTKDTPAWPSWAALVNATRNVVLQSSTCRDLGAKLAGRRR